PLGMQHISYDFYTSVTQEQPPNGWGAHRAATYRVIVKLLKTAGFVFNQYSDYKMLTTGLYAYNVMVILRFVLPPSKMATTLKGIRLTQFNLAAPQFDPTVHLQLGGFFSPVLMGPTPRNLAMNINLLIPPVPVPAAIFVKPKGTTATPAALNPANWL
ncbi:hypothetical protein BDP27DRAFT_1162551, partial [Rhodocollybia butyracea]